jgi:hypothetical protein
MGCKSKPAMSPGGVSDLVNATCAPAKAIRLAKYSRYKNDTVINVIRNHGVSSTKADKPAATAV